MHRPSYAVGRAMVRFVSGMYVRHRLVHGHRLRQPGPFVLACTHIGHLEPALIGGQLLRPVHWIAREEFFRIRPAAWTLKRLGAISVDRRGVPVAMVRESLRRLGRGGIVGIFPEGGRKLGDAQAVRGGAIKGGACLLAMRAGVPVVPVVLADTERLHAVETWVPGRRTTVRTIVGPLLWPASSCRTTRRADRLAMTARLADAFVRLHGELQAARNGRP